MRGSTSSFLLRGLKSVGINFFRQSVGTSRLANLRVRRKRKTGEIQQGEDITLPYMDEHTERFDGCHLLCRFGYKVESQSDTFPLKRKKL